MCAAGPKLRTDQSAEIGLDSVESVGRGLEGGHHFPAPNRNMFKMMPCGKVGQECTAATAADDDTLYTARSPSSAAKDDDGKERGSSVGSSAQPKRAA